MIGKLSSHEGKSAACSMCLGRPNHSYHKYCKDKECNCKCHNKKK